MDQQDVTEKGLYIYLTIFTLNWKLSLIILDLEADMKTMDLKGASRISGGLFRGRALGNALNAADLSAESSTNNMATIRGLVSIYQTIAGPGNIGNPDNVEADFKVKINSTLDAQKLCDSLLEQGTINKGK